MEFIDKYLKTVDQAELYAALDAAGLLIEGIIEDTPDYSIDEIGPLYTIDDVLLDGYHCNVRFLREPTADELAALDPISIPAPANPRRKWL